DHPRDGLEGFAIWPDHQLPLRLFRLLGIGFLFLVELEARAVRMSFMPFVVSLLLEGFRWRLCWDRNFPLASLFIEHAFTRRGLLWNCRLLARLLDLAVGVERWHALLDEIGKGLFFCGGLFLRRVP